MPQTRLGRNHRKQGFWHYFGRFLSWCFLVLGLLFVSGVGVFAYYAKSAPTVTTTKLQAGGSSALYTNDGKFLLSLGSDKRNYIRSDQIPQQLKDAVLSIEDKRFYNEPLGVDPIRIAGSLVANIKGHDISAETKKDAGAFSANRRYAFYPISTKKNAYASRRRLTYCF